MQRSHWQQPPEVYFLLFFHFNPIPTSFFHYPSLPLFTLFIFVTLSSPPPPTFLFLLPIHLFHQYPALIPSPYFSSTYGLPSISPHPSSAGVFPLVLLCCFVLFSTLHPAAALLKPNTICFFILPYPPATFSMCQRCTSFRCRKGRLWGRQLDASSPRMQTWGRTQTWATWSKREASSSRSPPTSRRRKLLSPSRRYGYLKGVPCHFNGL